MKIIAIIFLLIMSIIWYVLWWRYIQLWKSNFLDTHSFTYGNEDSITLIILAWMFVLWILFWKLLSSWKKLEKLQNNEVSLKNNVQQWFSFIPEIDENIDNITTHKAYEKDWEYTDIQEKKAQIQSADSNQIQLIRNDDFDYWPESHETKVEVENILIIVA